MAPASAAAPPARTVLFMAWDPSQLPSLTGKTAIVTGANSGIGWYTAAELAKHGADVTLAVRNLELGGRAADRIRAVAPGAEIAVRHLDLASLVSVETFADDWHWHLDLLINNAGLMTPRKWKPTQDGFELQFGTNHLGHFALTGRLLSSLLAADAPRVVTVSSLAHRSAKADVLDGNPAGTYRPQPAYAKSKLANLLFARELQRRASEHGTALTSTAAHPGIAATNLVASTQGAGNSRIIRAVAPFVLKALFQSAAAGANPTLYAAVEAEPGSYTGPQLLNGTRGPVGPAKLNLLAQDTALASKLWDLSEKLTGVRYDWN
jgi:NAD(P)-dependent dehydrogenase (short-subunit alcohol dehydrogenase family)